MVKLPISALAAVRAVNWYWSTAADPSDAGFERLFLCKIAGSGETAELEFTGQQTLNWFVLQWGYDDNKLSK